MHSNSALPFPTSLPCLQRVSARTQCHRDPQLARMLHARMRRRIIVLTRPVPHGVQSLIAEMLVQDRLVLALAWYANCNCRRHLCLARAFTPEKWREEQVVWGSLPVPGMCITATAAFWTDAPGFRGAIPF